MERLQKVIAHAGVASRRKAEQLILDGKVKVNDKVVRELGVKVTGKEKKSFWLKLDNAAKVFPGQNSTTWSNSFRVCYELNEKVDKLAKEAVGVK